jgi:hypothetical protein
MSITVIDNGWKHENTERLIKLVVNHLYASDGPLKVESTDPMVKETRDLAQRLEAAVLNCLFDYDPDRPPYKRIHMERKVI